MNQQQAYHTCDNCNQPVIDKTYLKTRWKCDRCGAKQTSKRYGCNTHDFDICSACFAQPPVPKFNRPPVQQQQQQFNQPPVQQQFNQPPVQQQQQQGFNQPPANQVQNIPLNGGVNIYNKGVMGSGQVLNPDQYISSPSGEHQLYFHSNGNLALYSNNIFNPQFAVWQTYEPQQYGFAKPYQLRLELDGAISVYDSTNRIMFSNNMRNLGQAPYRLCLSDNRNVCIVDNTNIVIWQSGSFQQNLGVKCGECNLVFQDMTNRGTDWKCDYCSVKYYKKNGTIRLRCQQHDKDCCPNCARKLNQSHQESLMMNLQCEKCNMALQNVAYEKKSYSCKNCLTYAAGKCRLKLRCLQCKYDLCDICCKRKDFENQSRRLGFNNVPQFNQPPK